MTHNENKEKGIKAENLFAEFLNNHKIPYYRIDQNTETYSDEFYKNDIRRPDYIIHTEKGLFHIDVKYRTKMDLNEEKRFYLNQGEIITLFNFQNKLDSSVWLSFTDNLENPIFYYISISEVYNYYKNLFQILDEKFFKEFQRDCWIFIPEKLLYEHLSFEKAFYREPDFNYFKEEAEYHRLKWKNLTRRAFS
jgi:hypothetical protein